MLKGFSLKIIHPVIIPAYFKFFVCFLTHPHRLVQTMAPHLTHSLTYPCQCVGFNRVGMLAARNQEYLIGPALKGILR